MSLATYADAASVPIAVIGKETISEQEYVQALERQCGKAVLTKMVYDSLVQQAAENANVLPSVQDVEERIQCLERRTPQALPANRQNAVKMTEFHHDLEIIIALENLRMRGVTVTPEEVEVYYQAHQAEYALPQQVTTNIVVTHTQADSAIATELLHHKTPPEGIARHAGLHIVGVNGFDINWASVSSELKKQISDWIQNASEDEVKTFPYDSAFLTFQVKKHRSAEISPLSQIRSQVERQARLEHAPSAQEELARLYQAAKPTFQNKKYRNYFHHLKTHGAP